MNKKYNIIYADPPWSYNDKNCNGNALNHYPTMKDKDIYDLNVAKMADDNCALFLWATYPKLAEALKCIEAWGFTYKTIAFQWIKTNKRANNSVSQLIIAPLTRHSEKPQEVRERVVQLMGDLPRIELFARNRADGWDVWGNEVDSDVDLGALE